MKVIQESILSDVVVKREPVSHKGHFGRVLLIGGFYPYGGAIIMAATGAVCSGAGLVTVATDAGNIVSLHAALPEAMALEVGDQERLVAEVAKSDVVLLGPGTAADDRTKGILSLLLGQMRPDQVLILDGGAIPAFAQLGRQTQARLVFTPHEKEFEDLTGLAIDQQTLEACQELVDRLPTGSLSLLKKHGTLVFESGSQEADQLDIGGPYQATGGMGDTLAGMATAFLSQFKQSGARDCLKAALYLHSMIARDLAQERYVVRPSEIARLIPIYMKEFGR